MFITLSRIKTLLILSIGMYFYNSESSKSISIENGDEKEFTRLLYNNPGLNVDLGVGLWAWPLPMDFDKDGDLDLLVSCPDTPFNGTYFFENRSGQASADLVFAKPEKIGEGMKNLQVNTKGEIPRVLGRGVEYIDFRDNIFSQPIKLFDKEKLEEDHTKIRFSQWNYVDYENDGDLDLLVGIDDWGDYGWDNAYDSKGNWTNGPLRGYIYLLENQDGQYVEKGKIMAAGKPIDVYGAPSPNMKDFDGDGDLDLICGEFLDKLTWFENTGTREAPVFAEGQLLANENGVIKMDLEMIVPTAVDWDGDNNIDLIVGDEDGRVAFIQNTGKVKDNMPIFKDPVYFKQEAQYVKFGALATPVSVDWDDDGDEDLIAGNSAGYIGFIENLDGGNPPKWAEPQRLSADGEMIRYLAGEKGSIQGPAEEKWGYTTLSVNDWDGDGLKDIIVNSIWGKVEWHKNIGKKGKPKLAPAKSVVVDWPSGRSLKPEWNWWDPKAEELVTQWRTTPVTLDWNKDGLMDLIMLDHEGYLSYYERFRDGDILKLKPGERIFYSDEQSQEKDKRSNGKIMFEPLRLNSGIGGKSGRKKLCFADWDGDGDLDLIVNSKNAAWYENVESKPGRTELLFRGDISEQKLAGHTTSPTVVDWDKDGVSDLLLGAEDGHFYYLKNEIK